MPSRKEYHDNYHQKKTQALWKAHGIDWTPEMKGKSLQRELKKRDGPTLIDKIPEIQDDLKDIKGKMATAKEQRKQTRMLKSVLESCGCEIPPESDDEQQRPSTTASASSAAGGSTSQVAEEPKAMEEPNVPYFARWKRSGRMVEFRPFPGRGSRLQDKFLTT